MTGNFEERTVRQRNASPEKLEELRSAVEAEDEVRIKEILIELDKKNLLIGRLFNDLPKEGKELIKKCYESR